MEQCNFTPLPPHDLECNPNIINGSKYTFLKDKCFRDGKYFGRIIYQDTNMIRVELKSDNRYMNGHIMEFHLGK